MDWIMLTSGQLLDEVDENSKIKPVVIFKHSTRCPVSALAYHRLIRQWNDTQMAGIKAYYLDILAYRFVSETISERYNIRHESPQLLLIRNGKCKFHSSHLEINYHTIKSQLSTELTNMSSA